MPYTTTANMALKKPTPGTSEPADISLLNGNSDLLDAHDHTSGKGAAVARIASGVTLAVATLTTPTLTTPTVKAPVSGADNADNVVLQTTPGVTGPYGDTATTFREYTTTGITTTPKKIAAGGNTTYGHGGLFLVTGGPSAASFQDLLAVSFITGTVNVINQLTLNGTAPTRTYSVSAYDLYLAVNTGTATAHVFSLTPQLR